MKFRKPSTSKSGTKSKTKKRKSNVVVEVADDVEITEEQKLHLKYKSMTVARLKEFMRKNKQLIGGKKAELVDRCVDGELNGALPVCPTCGAGKLKLNEDKKGVSCPGYFDEDCGMRISCSYVDDVHAVERNVWKNPEDEIESEDEAEDADKNVSTASPNVAKFIKLFQSSTTKGIAEVLKEIVKFCTTESNFKLPTDESKTKQKIGAMIMEHRNDGEINVEKLGIALVKVFGVKAKAKVSKAKVRAQVEENEGLANMLDEMAKNVAKVGGNMFKVRGLKKASIAIRSLSFVVTDGIAISKGKQKVAGIGKSTANLIEEYLCNDGIVQQLVDLRKEIGDN